MIKRELYLNKIRPFIGRDIIKVLTGIRRCGKSVMLALVQEELRERGIKPERFVHLNFDSGNLPCKLETRAVYAFIAEKIRAEPGKTYVFLDEIQDLPDWEKMLNALLIDFDVDIYVTGSNAKLLSGELATHLAGRTIQIEIFPFSYAEFLLARNAENTRASLEKFLLLGGMPFLSVTQIDDADASKYLNDIFYSIVLKDIVARHNIRDFELLRRFLLYFLANIGNVFSAKSVLQYLKNEHRSISAETLYNYIAYAQAAHFLHRVPREGVIGKKHLQFQEKIFVTDTGFYNALLERGLNDIGQLLENAVYLELLRRGYTVTVGKVGEREVDFVATGNGGKIYIQVCYILTDKTTIEREFSPFESIPDNFPKYVVSMDEIDFSHNGFKHLNIRDFLLSKELI
jgi:predicted AAA+ superfamily ATPase